MFHILCSLARSADKPAKPAHQMKEIGAQRVILLTVHAQLRH
jgi:hypothetical protein